MGRLTLPICGSAYIDTNIIIFSVEEIEPYHGLLRPFLAAAQAGQLHVITSELSALEVLVRPLREQNQRLVALFEAALDTAELETVPITLPILREAARLRADVASLRTPDAIHAATARLTGCDVLVSHDVRFRAVPGLNHLYLGDITG
jgi:predicted nucleic acid-binding protein